MVFYSLKYHPLLQLFIFYLLKSTNYILNYLLCNRNIVSSSKTLIFHLFKFFLFTNFDLLKTIYIPLKLVIKFVNKYYTNVQIRQITF